uniref:Uncharacterized protein n=1 Tax=Manihot esculenta TaxID=3983 RepID=A0A2C9UQ85_MANES
MIFVLAWIDVHIGERLVVVVQMSWLSMVSNTTWWLNGWCCGRDDNWVGWLWTVESCRPFALRSVASFS